LRGSLQGLLLNLPVGIFRYEQIAHWSESNVAAVASWSVLRLTGFTGRNWIRQARRLSEARSPAPAPAPPVVFGELTVLPDPLTPSPSPVLQAASAETPVVPSTEVPETIEAAPLREGAEFDPGQGYVDRSGVQP